MVPQAALAFIRSAGRFVSPELVRKGLEKISPKFKSYFSRALAGGFTGTQAIDYLMDRFGNPVQQQYANQLEQRGAQGQLTPDEMQAMGSISASKTPERLLKLGAGIGSALLSGSLGSPAAEQATQEEEAVEPRVGRAAERILGAAARQEGAATPVIAGRAVQSAKNALGTLESIRNPLTAFDMFKRENPDLGRFIEKKIGEGIPPMDAAKRARAVVKFKTPIKRLENRIGQKFESIIDQVFGGSPQASAPTASQSQQATPELSEILNLIKQYTAQKGARG